MYKRDLITAEIEKLAEVLARLLGLKLDTPNDLLIKEFDAAILANFSVQLADLLLDDRETLEQKFKEKGFSAEHIDQLSAFIYERWLISTPEDHKQIAVVLKNTLHILEGSYKYLSFQNMDRVEFVNKYLRNEN